MDFFEWTSEFELGIPVIDIQHKRIADYINKLHTAIENNNEELMKEVAESVVNYTCEHFAYEEALLNKSDYILTEPHIIVHNNFKASAAKMREEVCNGDNIIPAAKKMRSTLTIWLGSHIKKEDADWAESVGHLFRKKSFLGSVFNFFSKG